jgi:signal transduction histidine kinase
VKHSIKKNFRLAFIGISVVPLLLVGLLFGWQSVNIQLANAGIRQQEVGRRAADNIISFFNTAEEHLFAAIDFGDLKNMTPHRQYQIISQTINHKHARYKNMYYNIAVIDCRKGMLAYASLYGESSAAGFLTHFRVHEFLPDICRGRKYLSPVSFDEVTGEPSMTLAVPMVELRSGKVWGALAVNIRINTVWQIVGEIKVGRSGKVYIVDKQNRVVAHPDPSVVLRGTWFNIPEKEGLNRGLSGDPSVLVIDSLSINEQTFYIIAEQPLKETLSFTVTMLLQIGIIILLALLVSVLSALWAERKLVNPIELIAKQALRIGAGDLSQRIELERQDELGRLAQAFNTMAVELDSTIVSLKQEVADRRLVAIELEAANSELRDFAHVVSHDLKAPLRGVSQLAGWIAEDYADVIDEEGRNQIRLLLGRVQRMHRLIDAVLEYSKAGRISEKVTDVDLAALVQEIIDELSPPHSIRIIVENCRQTIAAERTSLKQVIQNLADNAVKYMDKKKGLVKIDCASEGAYWSFSVSDNGPGIAQKYHEKIFHIFETLSPRNEAESTGVGLSLVKKIVETFGGIVWLESQEGKGSTFFFTWPQKEGENNENRKTHTTR